MKIVTKTLHMMKIFLLFGFFLLFWCYISADDPCYKINDPTYGNIGNCIPKTTCDNIITLPNMCPSSPNNYVCCFNPTFPGREVRGVWIATVVNIDWPISPTDSVVIQKGSLTKFVNTLKSAGFNSIYFQARPHGDALYASPIEPWSEYLTGKQGQPPNPLWDPLEFLIDYAHSQDIEVHAWINPYRANMKPTTVGLSPSHMAIQYPEYTYPYSTFLWMDPGAQIVQNRTYDVTIDLVTRYDLDGLHMDDYFYPYPVAGIPFPDNTTYNEYLQYGGQMNREDWRRNNVNILVERINIGIHQIKPWIKFSLSPFGIYRAGHPEGMPRPIAGFDQYNELYADPKLWLQKGWVDVLQPQLYWLISAPNQSYPQLLDWWVSQNILNRHIYAGNYLSKVLEGWSLNEFKEQISISRINGHRSKGSWGNIQFSGKIIRDNIQGSIDYFHTNIYPFPALQPTFPWLAKEKPLPQPIEIINTNKTFISWENCNDNIYKIIIYKEINNLWQIFKILTKNNSHIDLTTTMTTMDRDTKGFYGISTLDRYGQESGKRFIRI